MLRLLMSCYHFECRLFQKVNRHFDKKVLNLLKIFSLIDFLQFKTMHKLRLAIMVIG